MAKIRKIKADALTKLRAYQKAETAPTVAGEYRRRQWKLFQRKKYSLEPVSDNPAARPVTFERGSQARAERDVIARQLQKHKDGIKSPYAVATNMVRRGAKAEDREAVAKELAEQKKMVAEAKNLRGVWHRKGEARTLTHAEMTKRQRFEYNISQFPEYKEMRRRGLPHDYAVSKTMERRGIKAPEGKMWFEAKVPPFTLKPAKRKMAFEAD